jgi:subtilisin family serine protease
MKTANSLGIQKTWRKKSWLLITLTFLLIFLLGGAQAFSQQKISPRKNPHGIVPGRYIVTFHDYIQQPDVVAERLAKFHKFGLRHVYRSALKGFSASMPESVVEHLKRDPDVAFVEPDRRVFAVAQTTPTGVMRIQADQNSTAQSNPVDVDVAIIDTGIDLDHPDLNVVANTRCTTWRNCKNNQGNDDNGHGTHVAGTVAARDNDLGVLGVAPGARLWAVKVLDSSGSGYLSWVIKGIDWVTAHYTEIEVANLSLAWEGINSAARQAIQNSVAQGVVYVVAASNESRDIYGADGIFGTGDDIEPASYPEVATISALCDTDGEAGGLGAPATDGTDDSFASFSNFSRSVVPENPVDSPGAAIDLLLPGVNILSTFINGGYAIGSGTSMASPHAAGLAALYIAENGRAYNAEEVYAIRQALIDTGVEQDGENGLSILNDPDVNWERLGWAGSATLAKDIAVKAISATPDSVFPSEVVSITVEVKNNGTEIFTDDYEVSVKSDNATPNDETDDFPIDDAQLITEDLASGAISTLTFSWTAPYTIGHHVLTATATYGYQDENPSNDVKSTSVEIMDPATPTTMHIHALGSISRNVFWSIWEAEVIITVYDDWQNPVPGATVNGLFSDGSTLFQCSTNSNGMCSVYGYQWWLNCLTFTVTDVWHDTLEYDPSSNIDQYIVVCRPPK